ncbi:MAG: acyl-CoA dehydrogenase family protein [Myxococcota bacterium]|nr:acyl-CoA dehydrogenase family protein [Myxococcota bacterium]
MTREEWMGSARELGARFGERAAAHDSDDRFVAENYADLRKARMFSLGVPASLGGGGALLADLCEVIRELAHHCPSTALAFSMHQHLVAANVFKHLRGDTPPLLRKIAERELVLVSTGATDWIDSNGSATRVDGGYRVRGRKVFASGAPGADLLITSIASADEPEGPSVLHFPLALAAEGVRMLDDWHTRGMRGTGSHTVLIEDAFVPDAAIALKRPAGQWHAIWNVVLGVAPPIYMAPYLGLAERAAAVALEQVRARKRTSGTASLVGEMHTALTQAQLAWEDMVRLSGDYSFTPSLAHSSAQLTRKSLLASAAKRTVELACELSGGASFYRSSELERAFRDIGAAHYHPLPERRQRELSGLCLLGEDPSAA